MNIIISLVAAVSSLISMAQATPNMPTDMRIKIISVAQSTLSYAANQVQQEQVNNTAQVPVKLDSPAIVADRNNGEDYRVHPMCGEHDQYSNPSSSMYNALCDRTLNPLRAN